MPTYEYRCNNCEHNFETLQSIKADPLKDCPECNTPNLKRLIGTGAGILFKGSGFYQTDYRSESYKTGQSKESKTKESKTKPKQTNSN